MELTEKHIRVANALAEGNLTQGEIAQQYGISARTIYNWEKDPNFQKHLEEIKNRWKGIAQVMAGRWAVEAVKTLRLKLRSSDDEVGRKAAVDLLRIAGLEENSTDDKKQSLIQNIYGDNVSNIYPDKPSVADRAQTLANRLRGIVPSGN